MSKFSRRTFMKGLLSLPLAMAISLPRVTVKAEEEEDTIRLERVWPFKVGDDGSVSMNPEYENAEYSMGVVYARDVYGAFASEPIAHPTAVAQGS